MSLFDYLNSDTTSSSSTTTLSLLQQIAAQQGISVSSDVLEALGDSSSTSSSSSVQISVDAQRASAEAADADKDAATLVDELRATLDSDGTGSMGAMSNRALSLIALNGGGGFSKAESAAAKAALRERDRADAIGFLNSNDLTASALKAYSQDLLAARQTMSAEEKYLRDNDPDLR